jgi:membrane-associated phospholipid phosphatase
MPAMRKLFILLLLILPQSIFSQNTISPIPSSDSASNKSILFKALPGDVVRSQWIKGAIIPAGLILAGAITLMPDSHTLLSKYTIHNKVKSFTPDFHSSLDNYMQYAPLAAVFGLKAGGVKSRSDFVNQIVITAKAELLMTVIVRGMKRTIPSERPSGSGMNSMPSGHTAQAFVSATILDMEYRNTSPWISVGGYAVATTTAIYRMANNRHWISDVLIGAGIGIFSTKIVYYTHRYHWGGKKNMVILPAIYKNGGGVSFAMIL